MKTNKMKTKIRKIKMLTTGKTAIIIEHSKKLHFNGSPQVIVLLSTGNKVVTSLANCAKL